MNVLKPLAAAAVLLAAVVTAAPADAHGYYGYRGYWYGPSVRFYYGGPFWWGGGYYGGPPYGYWPYGYAPPPVVVSPPSPPVYIERDPEPAPTPSAPAAPSAAPAAPGTQWWYLCANPRGAYPYVRECPGGWERVPAAPPPTR